MRLTDTGVAVSSYQQRMMLARDPTTGRFVKGKGHPGRKVGSRNKRRRPTLMERLEEGGKKATASIDPIVGLARIATDENLDVRTRFLAWKTLARYIYPQQKAVHVDDDDHAAVGDDLV